MCCSSALYPLKMNETRHTELLEHLKELGHHVHYALLDSGLHDEPERAKLRAAWPSSMIYPYRQLPAEKDIRNVQSWLKPDTGKQILSLCGEQKSDIVFCPYLFQAEMLRYIPDNLLKVIDLRGQTVSTGERRLLQLADILLVDSPDEANALNESLGREAAIIPDESFKTILEHSKLVTA